MRVRATVSPRAHPLEVVGHGRRSPRFRNPLIGALRGTQHVIKRAAISRTRHIVSCKPAVNSETM